MKSSTTSAMNSTTIQKTVKSYGIIDLKTKEIISKSYLIPNMKQK